MGDRDQAERESMVEKALLELLKCSVSRTFGMLLAISGRNGWRFYFDGLSVTRFSNRRSSMRHILVLLMMVVLVLAMASDASAFHRAGRCGGGLVARHRHGCGNHSSCGHHAGCGSSVSCSTTVCGDAINDEQDEDAYGERDDSGRSANNNDSVNEESPPGPPRSPSADGEQSSASTNGADTSAPSQSTNQAEAPREINNRAANSSENVQGNPQP
jgi:hypothetical protein